MTDHEHKNKARQNDDRKSADRQNADHKSADRQGADRQQDSAPTEFERPPKTVRVLGMELEPAQFMIVCLFAVPLALVYQSGAFEAAGLTALQTLAFITPLVALPLALAFIRTGGHSGGRYLYMVLTEKLTSRKGQPRTNHQEDKRA